MKMRYIHLMPLLAMLLSASFANATDNSWLVLERKSDGNPEIVSVVRSVPPADIRSRFPALMEVAWGYKALPNGLPTEEELVRAHTLYAGIDKIVGANGVHAMTRTGDGDRTMYFYVADAEQLRKSIRRFFDAQRPISVKVSASSDPNWNAVQRVLNGVNK